MQFLFYGHDGDAAKAKAAEQRKSNHRVRAVHASACFHAEPCNSIAFMPDVSEYERRRLSALFGDNVAVEAQRAPVGDGAPATGPVMPETVPAAPEPFERRAWHKTKGRRK